jgi:cytochrome c-type biogenesis protein CcmH/NrfF
VTASFTTGQILSWLVPLAVFVAVWVWWVFLLRRRREKG